MAQADIVGLGVEMENEREGDTGKEMDVR